jgi:hypothetical protein
MSVCHWGLLGTGPTSRPPFFVAPIEFNEKRVQLERNGPITVCQQDGQLVRNLANEIKINRNVILSFPEHEARVLETPLNIGNDELSPRRRLRSIHVNLHWNRQVVRIAEWAQRRRSCTDPP